MSKYSDKLKDPRWQKKRLEILERDNWACQICGDDKNTLHVHHRRYIRGNEPWEYEGGDLVALCADCHTSETEGRSEAIDLLVEAISVGGFLFTAHAQDIARGIGGHKLGSHADLSASMISYALTNEEVCRYIHDKFMDNLGCGAKEK